MLVQTPGGKSYDAVLVLGTALDQMIKDGFNIKEASLGFNFDRTVASNPWAPGKKFMEHIKNVSIGHHATTRENKLRDGSLEKQFGGGAYWDCIFFFADSLCRIFLQEHEFFLCLLLHTKVFLCPFSLHCFTFLMV